VSSNPAEMFEITTTMKAGQQPDLARRVRRGWLIAIIVLVVAMVAMGFVAQLNADDPGPSISAPALTG
jgi:beta-lactamase regulating signal transducer with metallopeptidase domain